MKPTFADLDAFQRDPLDFLLERVAHSPAPLEPLALGPDPTYLVTDPELARSILRMPEADIDKGRLVRKWRPLLGESFLTLSGEEHRRRREVLHKQLMRGVAGQYIATMAAVVRQGAAALVRLSQFDAHQVVAPLALNLICVALFGHDVLSPGDKQALIGAMNATEDELADEMFRATPLSLWAKLTRRLRRKRARSEMAFVVNRVRARTQAKQVCCEDLSN
jgi:cytochrome P450